MNLLLDILGSGLWISIAIIIPCLIIERIILQTNPYNYRTIFSIFFQSYNPNRRYGSLMLWLPLMALAATFCQIALLYLPAWPFSAMTVFKELDLPVFIIISLTANVLIYTSIWLGESTGASLYFSQNIASALRKGLISLIILTNIVAVSGSIDILGIVEKQQGLSWNLLPNWNIWLLPISFFSFCWLLLDNYQERLQSRYSALIRTASLENHSSFDRLLIEVTKDFDGLSWTLLGVLLFMGGISVPTWFINLTGLEKPFLLLLCGAVFTLIKLALLLLLLAPFHQTYVEQTNIAKNRLTISQLLPANLVQFFIVITARYFNATSEQMVMIGLATAIVIIFILRHKKTLLPEN